MASTRTLARMVRKLEASNSGSRLATEWSARHEAQREFMRRVAACPEAHRAAIEAAEWLALNLPSGADYRDYPEALRLIAAVEAALAVATPA